MVHPTIVKIIVGPATIEAHIDSDGKGYNGYTILLNKKVQKASTYPKRQNADIKMDVMKDVLELAFYEIRHALRKAIS